jgi:rubrerythrin
MSRFHCSGCNYDFEQKEGKPPKKCPYCGRMGTIRRERTASELLNEVDAMLKGD